VSDISLDDQRRLSERQRPRRCALALLRGFEVRSAGVRVELPLVGQRLLAFLALQDHPLQRGYVAGSLWGDASEAHAQAALRTTLWRIRQRVADVISTSATDVALSRDVEVDLREAGRCAHRAIRERGVPDPEDVAYLCDVGDLLPDWYDDWLVIERERFRQLRLGALEAMCEDLSAQGRYAEATEAGTAAIAAEPFRESAHRALVRAHLEAGNPGEALRDYELFRKLLREQLGLEPSRLMLSLVQDLVATT
jgi:DNA-binding SARP family transcriptional activator